jgi:1A family penicillin-binding protein
MSKIDGQKKKKKSIGKTVLKVFLTLFLVLFLTVLILGIVFYNKYGKQLFELKEEAERIAAASKKEDFRAAQTSICYWSDGSVLSVLKGDKNVFYLTYDAIPENCINAMLATEDRKFYEHSGYDIYAIIRAAKAYLDNEGEIRQGGSTITQQLARTVYLTNEKTVERKVKEVFLAVNLEKKYTKDEILEFYINNIYFANGYYGIQAASNGYFGRPVGELDLSEIAFLCGIPNSPRDYDPLKRFDNAMIRRDSVLLQMKNSGFITKEEYEEALSKEIKLSGATVEKQDYAETFAYFCAVRALMKQEGFEIRNSFFDPEDKAQYEEMYEDEYYRLKRSLYTKGYRIYTSLNHEKQELLQATIDEELKEFDEKQDNGIYSLQASGACIDNDTGYVVAIIGGRGQEYEGYTLNRAFQSPRQPGSSIKPLIVYTPSFERGYYPDTTVIDEKFSGGPKNSGGVYSGEIDVRYAVSVSKNTVAWKLFEELTPRTGLSYLLRMGFGHIVEKDYVPAAALGGLTYGVTAVEMAGAYAAICNGGVYRDTTCIMRISDADGNTVAGGYGNENDRVRVYDENAALMMTDVLKTVMTSGTGRRLALSGITSAGKTGTTNDQRDGWFVGYTAYYTTAIWVGYDYPREFKELMGNTYPGYIWKNYMDKIHEGLPDRQFKLYTDNREPRQDTEGTEEDGIGDGDNTEDEIYTDTDNASGFKGKVLYLGEDGSEILLSPYISEDEETDWEGKPVYFDEDGERFFYDKDGGKIRVGADGYPDGYFKSGSWTLYGADGRAVMHKTPGEEATDGENE